VVDLWVTNVFAVDTTGICLEGVGSLDTAADWAVLIDFSLHLGGTDNTVVVLNKVCLMLDSPTFVLAVLPSWAWWPGAVLASSLSIEISLKIFSNVLLA